MAKHKFEWFSYVYLLECSGLYKIGFSTSPRKRAKALQTGTPHKVWVVHIVRSAHYRWIEQQLHRHFAGKRERGEWFKLDESDVEYIKSLDSSGFPPDDSRYDPRFRDSLSTSSSVLREKRFMAMSEMARQRVAEQGAK